MNGFRVRVERTEHGVKVTNAGSLDLYVGPEVLPEALRPHWQRLRAGESYETMIGGDLYVVPVPAPEEGTSL